MDTVDAAVGALLFHQRKKGDEEEEGRRESLTIDTLNSEMPGRRRKDRGKRMVKNLLNRLRLRRSASATISRPDPTYKVAYLGNVVTGWAKGDGCVEKPLATLWRNYTQSSRPDVRMCLTIGGGGLRATTRDHGLTEYWAHRLTTCCAPDQFPRLFCWVYRHEGRKLRHELRCHAVLCATAAMARRIEGELKEALSLALLEFKRDKLCRQNARLSLANSVYDNPTIPRRKILLSTGQTNYRPPLERSKSAPKLCSIEELVDEEEDDQLVAARPKRMQLLKHYDSTGALLDKRKCGDEEEEEEEEEAGGDLILQELVQSALSKDLVESCEQAWMQHLRREESIPEDSDEGSLSSGCESSSSSTTTTPEAPERQSCYHQSCEEKTDFKVGAPTMRYSLNREEVSLIPVGETQHADFSSLKVFKRKTTESARFEEEEEEEGENLSACSDESGYEEEEMASSVSNIVLV